MNKLRSAIIGCGNIHEAHADSIKNNEDAELVAVVDIKENRAKRTAIKYGCKYFQDYLELKNLDLDVVHICTPHDLHVSMAINMMKNGYDVLVEKPIALNLKEANKMNNFSKKSGRRLGVVFQNRFNKNSQYVKKIIQKKEMGKILGIKGFVTWHRDKDYYLKDEWRGSYNTEGGGVLISQAIHTLDLIQWFGGKIDSVKGSRDIRVLDDIIEVEDTAEATLYFADNTVGLFYATNCFSTNSPVEIEIHFEKGIVRLIGNKLIVNNKEINFSDDKNRNDSYKNYWGYGHEKLIDGFYKDILHKTNLFTIDGSEGIKSLKLIEGINISHKTGKKYDLYSGDET